MKFKDVAISNVSTEAKVAALAVLLDKELLKLAETVLNVQKIQGPQGEQGLQGPKGEQGDRGFDGTNGKDGSNGKDGKDGEAGKQGVGVQDAKIDFDGSLVITLTDGTEINAGEIVPLDTAEKIRVIGNGGGTSQSVLDAIEAIQATIAAYGTMATQNANNVAITGGSINGTTVGSITPAAGTFTALSTGTLTATGQTSLGGAAGSESLRVLVRGSSDRWLEVDGGTSGTGGVYGTASLGSLYLSASGGSAVRFFTNGKATAEQFRVANTASAVNYVQVTGAATTVAPQISAQGSDTNVGFSVSSKGTGTMSFYTNSVNVNSRHLDITHTGSVVNRFQLTGAITGNGVTLGVNGSDTNISQVFQSKGTGAFQFQTNAGAQEQLRVAHTASAVNYVQVTGAATGSRVALSAQGSDTNIGFAYNTKGAQNHVFQTNSSNLQFVVANRASTANWTQVQGNTAGNPPAFSVDGSDTNIDLSLIPKGTGNVRFGTYTASMALTVQGYIEIKDSGGTVRKLAVIA